MSGDDNGSLRVYLLGRFEVERGDAVIAHSAWRRKRPVELLSQLALSAGHVMHREEVIDRMWPDKDLEAGANNLYRTVHDLRRTAGSDIVTLERGVVRLGEEVWVDVDAFEKAASAGSVERLVEAVALYRGDLLPDDPYSDAIIGKRQALRQRFVDVALRLSRHHEDQGDRDGCIDVLRRLLAVDVTLEEGHRRLMCALAQAGRRKEALRQYGDCVQALRQHLDIEPGEQTHSLKARIEAGEIGPADEKNGGANGHSVSATKSASKPPEARGWLHVATRLLGTEQPPPIRGRADETAEVATFAASDCGVLLLMGEAGFGKTRLAVECARMAAERGDAVLVGLGYEFSGTAPYTPFVDAWSDYLRMLGRPLSDNPFVAFEPTPGASAQEDRMRLFDMVERSLVELADDGSVCLLVEDLHDADESSLLLLYHLARASRHLPIKLVGTARDEGLRVGTPLHTLVAGLSRERLATRLTLERLDLAATHQMLLDQCGEAVSEEVAREVYRLCEGHPFYTGEVATMIQERGCQAEVVASDDLIRSISERVSALGGEVERLLLSAAVYGVRFDFEVVAEAAGLAPAAALDALEVGLAARVVEEHGGEYCFRHALTREALCGSLTHARRVFLHRAVSDALEKKADPNDPPHELLAHLHQAAGRLERALPHLMAASARARSRLGFGEAVGFCQRAIELMDAIGMGACQQRLDMLQAMGGMRVALGDLDGAVENLEAAAALFDAESGWRPDALQRARANRIAGLALIEGGNLSAAEKKLDTALEALGEEPRSDELSSLFYLFSQLRWHQNRHAEAFELAEKCLVEAEKIDDVQAIAKGYEMLALACHSLGDWKKGNDFETKRAQLSDGSLDVASAFDVHL